MVVILYGFFTSSEMVSFCKQYCTSISLTTGTSTAGPELFPMAHMATYAEDLAAVETEVESTKQEEIISIGFPLLHYIQRLLLAIGRFIKLRKILETGKMDFTRVDKLKLLAGACRELYSRASVIVFPSSAAQKAWEKAKEEAEYLLYFIVADFNALAQNLKIPEEIFSSTPIISNTLFISRLDSTISATQSISLFNC
jgi:hypothetical protein